MTVIKHMILNLHKFPLRTSLLLRLSLFKRTMMSRRCIQAARAAYYVASTISNQGCLDNKNTQPFISNVVANTISYQQGIPQHKATLWKHLSHQRTPGKHFYESLIDQVPNKLKDVVLKLIPSISSKSTTTLSIKDFISIQGKESLHLFLSYFEKLPDV